MFVSKQEKLFNGCCIMYNHIMCTIKGIVHPKNNENSVNIYCKTQNVF